MWICPKCNERIEDQFDSCWKCAGQLQPAVTQDKDGSPLWSVLSLAFPVCSLVIAFLVFAGRGHGGGNLEIFPQRFAIVVLSYLGFSVVGIIFGLVGLARTLVDCCSCRHIVERMVIVVHFCQALV